MYICHLLKQLLPKCMQWTQECEKEVSAPEIILLLFVVDRRDPTSCVCSTDAKLNFKDVHYATFVLLEFKNKKKKKNFLHESNLWDLALGIPAVLSTGAACVSTDWNNQHELFQHLVQHYQYEWDKSAAPGPDLSVLHEDLQTVRWICSVSGNVSTECMKQKIQAERGTDHQANTWTLCTQHGSLLLLQAAGEFSRR